MNGEGEEEWETMLNDGRWYNVDFTQVMKELKITGWYFLLDGMF